MHRITLQPGAKLILLYVIVAYIIPGLLVAISGMPDIYVDFPIDQLALCVLIAALLAYLGLSGLASSPTLADEPRYRFRFIAPRLQIALLIPLVAAAAYGFFGNLAGFRYSAEGLSERDSPLALAFALIPTVLDFLLLVYIFYDQQFSKRRGPARFVIKALLLAGFLLAENGIATMMMAAICAVYVFFPRTFTNLLFRPSDNAGRPRGARLLRTIGVGLVICLLACAGGAAWILGEATKRGNLDSVIALVTGAGVVKFFLNWGVSRTCPSYVSLVVALHHYALSTDVNVIRQHLMEPFQSFLFRANYLLLNAFDVARPVSGSIMRVNYLLISAIPSHGREGTSPGLIGGFLYSFPFPFNFAVLIGYLLVLQRFLNRLIAALPGRLTVAGWLIFLIFMLPLFVSPVDFLLIVDEGVIQVLLLLLLRQVFIRRAPGSARSLSCAPLTRTKPSK